MLLRFSISWSRVLPRGLGESNQAGIQYYKDLIRYRTGIILYLEYQSVCPFVRIGPPSPSPESECVLPPPKPKGGGGRHSLGGEGENVANSDDWRESLVLCILCVRFISSMGTSEILYEQKYDKKFLIGKQKSAVKVTGGAL
jgi:hypothetical protein